MLSENIQLYQHLCARHGTECVTDFVDTLERNDKIATLGNRTGSLSDVDVVCIANVIMTLGDECAVRVWNFEGNSFGLVGVEALLEAASANPGRIRELRLGKNNLRDQVAVLIGDTLSDGGCGLRVLDLSENEITKFGVIPIAAALQHPSSNLVELSFHNNKIDEDAALFLAEALGERSKLKHLHLGYNALRDAGAVRLAQSLLSTQSLVTLDLTANYIGSEGGKELAAVLMNPACTLQRLNLRHNAFDSETVELFAHVIQQNRSLIQLFLGYMHPTPEAAAAVLDSLRFSSSLLLLDILGWKLSPKRTASIFSAIQQSNTSVAAIVTDACQPIASLVDAENIAREERSVHPIYVGPDDRDAYLATKSLRRFSRANSFRQSRASSIRASRTCSRTRGNADSLPACNTDNQLTSNRTASADEADGASDRRGRRSSRNTSLVRRVSSLRRTRAEAGSPYSSALQPKRHNGTTEDDASVLSQSLPGVPSDSHAGIEDPDVEGLLSELQAIPYDKNTTETVRRVVEVLWFKLSCTRAQHQKEITALTSRVAALEGLLGGGQHGASASVLPKRSSKGGLANGDATSRLRKKSHPTGSNGNPISDARASLNGSAILGDSVENTSYYSQKSNNTMKHQHRLRSHTGVGVHSTDQRSESYMSDGAPVSMVEPPLERRDTHPELARPNDESGDQKPEETVLQKSAPLITFPPAIEPSPAQDLDPPRRKSVAGTY